MKADQKCLTKTYLFVGSGFCLLSILALFLYKLLFVEYISYVCIAVINLFLITLLFKIAELSDLHDLPELKGQDKEKAETILTWIPSRVTALILFTTIIISIVCFFASAYLAHKCSFDKPITNPHDAVYFTFGVLTTVNFGDFHPIGHWMMTLTMLEVLSSVILFFGAFALLISRLATFSSAVQKPDIEQALPPLSEIQLDAIATRVKDMISSLPVFNEANKRHKEMSDVEMEKLAEIISKKIKG